MRVSAFSLAAISFEESVHNIQDTCLFYAWPSQPVEERGQSQIVIRLAMTGGLYEVDVRRVIL